MENNTKAFQEKLSAYISEVFLIEIEGLRKFLDKYNKLNFANAVQILHNCTGKVIIIGIGKSGIIGRKIAATLASTGTTAYFLHPAEALHGDLGIVQSKDAVIWISKSGDVSEFNPILVFFKRHGLKIIAISGSQESDLAVHSDAFLDASVEKEACPLNLAPTASSTLALVIGDALAVCLLNLKNFDKNDFAIVHPGGNLGRRLTATVGDYMLRNEKLPVVYVSAKMSDALDMITKNRGIVAIVDNEMILQGVLTYGDIGRYLKKYKDIFSLNLYEVMTKKPKTIRKEKLAIEAAKQMEKNGNTSLIVVDENNKPTGVIHLHDLMRAYIL